MVLVGCNYAYAQEKVEITLEDLKIFRQSIIERDSFKKERDEAIRQRGEWQKSSQNWQGLYLQEKSRADITQENRIKECDASKGELFKANQQLHIQHDDDKREISNLRFDVAKLKSSQKYYFAGGFGSGLVVGGIGGYAAGKRFNF